MLSGLISSLVGLEPPQVSRAVLDNPDSLIPNTKLVYVLPDWLEKKSKDWEDTFILHVQSYVSGPVVFLTRMLKVTHTVWLGVMAVLFFYLAGYDRFCQLWASHVAAGLLVALTLKRFVWRHRPYVVRRARLALTTSQSSSFPSRSVLFSLVYVYLCQEMLQITWRDLIHIDAISIFQTFVIPVLFLLAGLSLFAVVSLLEILKGVHYPSDCLASLFLAVPVIVLGGWLQSVSSSLYPVLTLAEVKSRRVEDVQLAFMEYKEMQFTVLLKWGLVGAAATVVLQRSTFLNWSKLYRVAGVLVAVGVAMTSLSCDAYNSPIIPAPSLDTSLRNLLGMLATVWLVKYLSKWSFVRPVKWWAHIFAFFFVYCSCLLAVSLWRVWLVDHKPLPPLPVVAGVLLDNATTTTTDAAAVSIDPLTL